MIVHSQPLDRLTIAVQGWYKQLSNMLAKAEGQDITDPFKTLRIKAWQARESTVIELEELKRLGEKHKPTPELERLLFDLQHAHLNLLRYASTENIDENLKSYFEDNICGGKENQALVDIREYFRNSGVAVFADSH